MRVEKMSEKDRLREQYYRAKAVRAMDKWNETHPIWERIDDFNELMVAWEAKHEEDEVLEEREVGESNVQVEEKTEEVRAEAVESFAEPEKESTGESEHVEDMDKTSSTEGTVVENATQEDELALLKARIAELEKEKTEDEHSEETDE